MKLIIYGTDACPDCVEAVKLLDEKNVDYTYMEFSESTANLKEFLKLRDTEAMFDTVKKAGGIGVPCFQLSDGTLTFELDEVLENL